MERTQLLFRTLIGSQTIEGETTKNLTADTPYGIAVFNYPIIRVLFGSRVSSGSSVTFNLVMLQGQEMIGTLEPVTINPGESVTRTYEVPGLALALEVTNNGTKDSYIDAFVYGYGPVANWNCQQ